MLGHASLLQTSTYLNTTLRGLYESMRTLEKPAPLASPKLARNPRPPRKQTPAVTGKSLYH